MNRARSILILNNAVMTFKLPYNTPTPISNIEDDSTISIDVRLVIFAKKSSDEYQTVTVNVGGQDRSHSRDE